jgi:hypothetical protein
MSLKRKNEDFSVAETLKNFIRNYDWQQGFDEVVKNELPRLADGRIDLDKCPAYASLWLTLSASFEPEAAQIYERISNIVQSTVDVETCSIHALKSVADSLGIENFESLDIGYPLEVKELIDIFSVSPVKLTNGSLLTTNSSNEILSGITRFGPGMEGYIAGWVNVSGTAWNPLQGEDAKWYHTSAIWTSKQYSNITNALAGRKPRFNDGRFLSLMESTFLEVLSSNITLDRIIDDMYNSIYDSSVIDRKTSSTVLEPPEDSDDINEVKEKYGVPLTFFANAELDDIIAGRKLYESYTIE